jgi:hypothetical protein
LHNDGFDLFNIVVDRPNSVYLYLEGFVDFWLAAMINLLFRKDILSSAICCKVVITVIYLVKPSSKWMIISWLAPLGEGVFMIPLAMIFNIITEDWAGGYSSRSDKIKWIGQYLPKSCACNGRKEMKVYKFLSG